MAIVQLRNPSPGRTYYDARKGAGTPSLMAIRALKRRLSNIVYTRMLTDQQQRELAREQAREQDQVTGPGGQRGNDSVSSAASSQPHPSSSDKPLPGPATTQPRTPLAATP